jgi:serine/threonine-protein kinase
MLRTSDGGVPNTSRPGADHFAPGTILADRYRIVALLGRGGMGHVYRAEDMKLGQTVALKFLPPSMTGNARHLELMLSEVRLARQVSSPYVCRVHDIVESDGLRFLSMEYVDGENLAGLLRRIRRLPPDRAQEIAWQICEGLGAAHAMGVLHRDLKPANLMIDGLGRPKITDFGLALDVEDAAAKSEVAGTPGYIAPEVALGLPVSVQSDLYGLGAILYEIYTGHRAVEGATPGKPGQGSSSRISTHFPKDVPKPVQLIIQRCLEPDPAQRPRSAKEVSAAFPVRDTLALAEAAGETPSPEMVAAAGSDEPLALWKAWSLLLFIFASIALLPYGSKWLFTPSLSPWAGPPQHFETLTQSLLKQLGYNAAPSDSYSYFTTNDALIADHLHKADRGDVNAGKGAATSREAGLAYEQGLDLYLHRQRATGLLEANDPFNNLDWNDPPVDQPGMVNVEFDSRGHLLNFLAIPAREVPATDPVREPDWRAAFAAAGLNPAQMEEVPAAVVPAVPFDWRKQWRGALPGYPATQVQVVATGFDGKLTSFRVFGPWDSVDDSQKSTLNAWWMGAWSLLPIGGTLVLGFFAVRNWRRDRADTTGAFRLAATVVALYFFHCALLMRYSPDTLMLMTRLADFLGMALLWGGLCGTAYLAIEPYLRRKMPRLLISWTRVLKGQVRNPLVGKDLLAGIALFTAEYPFGILFLAWNAHARTAHNFPVTGFTERALYEPLAWLGAVFADVYFSIYLGLFVLAIYFVFRAVFRVRWLAVAALGVFLFFFGGGPPHYSSLDFILINLAIGGLCMICALRFGLLTTIVFELIGSLLFSGPITFNFSDWFTPATLANLGLVMALAIFAFWTAIGDQRIFGNFKLDD